MSEGRTVHNLFKFPVPYIENSTCSVSPSSNHAKMLEKQVALNIGASMMPTHALRAIDRCLLFHQFYVHLVARF